MNTLTWSIKGVEQREIDASDLVGIDHGDHIFVLKDRRSTTRVKVNADEWTRRVRGGGKTRRVLLVKPADVIYHPRNADPDRVYGDEERVPMQYLMSIERDGIATRYTFQLNDLGTVMLITDAERHFADFPAARAHRAAICERVLWQAVEKRRPIYFERAKALGWVT